MYSKKVMEHFPNPRNVGEIEDPDGVGEVGNPVCGDMMTFGAWRPAEAQAPLLEPRGRRAAQGHRGLPEQIGEEDTRRTAERMATGR